MGRQKDTNTNQYHEGLHHQAPETIDDAPPLDEGQDLYEPLPPGRHNHQPLNQSLPTDEKPRSVIPSKAVHQPTPHHQHEGHHDYNNLQTFPSSQDETPAVWPPQQSETPAVWPPQQSGTPAVWPPQQSETPAVWPPPADEIPAMFSPHEAPPQSAPQPQNTQFTQQPVQVVQTPVRIQPSTVIQVQNQFPTQAWKTDLFDCMQDPKNAIITAFFPCITFGQIAEILDNGRTSCATSGMYYSLIACCIAMPCIMSCAYRSKMRSRFGLMESPLPDCIVHCFCEWCALCQEYRELQERGIDPSIGWLGNLAKQQQQQQQQFVFTAPPMQQRMM